ncbi:hypothetical protein PAEPH01_1044 [Pancytospora epiphaga]|nr:hypothetical protein PAEPH01_1044 [Pancytospora epiphaga]
MAENEENKKSRIPFYCGIGGVFVITILLLITEWLTDASIMLNRWRLSFLVIVLIPFLFIGINLGVIGDIVAIVVFLIILGLSISLYVDRNRVERIFIGTQTMDESQTNSIMDLLKRPVTVSIGGDITELPESLKKYNNFSSDEYKKFNDRFNPHEGPSKDVEQKDLTPNKMDHVRLSGIKEHAIVMIPSNVVTTETYESHGYKAVPTANSIEDKN